MALATSPVVPTIRPACKRRVEKPVVVMKDARPEACSYHKRCLKIVMEIYEKNKTMSTTAYNDKVTEISKMVTCEKESSSIFQTFCGMSFLDRYQDEAIVACIMQDMDRKIHIPSWKMVGKLEGECVQLLTRMGMIENLSSLDTDLVCLLCRVCKTSSQGSGLFDFLLEIGRSVWPYINRPLWQTEPFVDFVADIFEAVGERLEQLYPKNFSVAWKVILKNLVEMKTGTSLYSRLRMLSIVEHKHAKWSLPQGATEFYREQYNKLSESRKKEIMVFLGLLSSRRQTSLTVKPGRSAADFKKRRQSSETQENNLERCSSSSSDSPVPLNGVCEDVFERIESLRSAASDSPVPLNGVCEDVFERIESLRSSASDSPVPLNGVCEDVFERIESLRSSASVGSLAPATSDKIDSSSVQDDTYMNEQKGYVKEQDGNLKENEAKVEEAEEEITGEVEDENVWRETGDTWQETGNMWRESENTWRENTTSPRSDEISSNETNKSVPEHRSFLFDRKKEIVKVPGKYVGRVIGAQGSVIVSIQEQSGARVHIVRQHDQKDQVVGQRPAFSMNTINNIVHNSLGIPLNKTSTQGNETTLEEDSKVEEQKEEVDAKDGQADEIEFEIIGTDETIEKAKWKIESIISCAKSSENHTKLKRSFSETSYFQERRRVIMKVGKKYVGRVIGSGGSTIMAIEEESGAKVTFVKDERTAKYKTNLEQQRNVELKKALEIESIEDREGERSTEANLDHNVETLKEQDRERQDVRPSEQVRTGEENVTAGQRTIDADGEITTVLEKGHNSATSSEESQFEPDDTKVERTPEEYDFEIFGTEEAIEKAKRKIEYIIQLTDRPEKKLFTRSFSYAAPARGFQQLQRSLSCPITDWGDDCRGECADCQERRYCRSFLLLQSECSPCWVRPHVLDLTQHADWAEFIVKTKVDDRTLWRPRKSSDASINTSSSNEDITKGFSSPRSVTSDHSTAGSSPEPAEDQDFPSGTSVTID